MNSNKNKIVLNNMPRNTDKIDVWHEVSENTKVIYIVNRQDIRSIISDISVQYKSGIIINLFDFPTIPVEFFNFKDMPKNLPNLEVIFVHNLELKNLEGLPVDLPNLKKLFIFDTSLRSLKGLPSELPSLKKININNVPLESLQYAPKSLPNLEEFNIVHTEIETLNFFPLHIPNLKKITLLGNKFDSLKGMPSEIPLLKFLWLDRNQLISLEHLPHKFKKLNERSIDFMISNNPIRTLAGIKFPLFFNRIIKFGEKVHKHRIKGFQLCPAAMKLINDFHEKKIQVETMELNMSTNGVITHKMVKDPARYVAIVEFYRKTPMELAQQLIENPNSLSDDEFDRLGWEGGYQERKLLEPHLSLDHPILWEISQRLTHKLPSGFSILK